MICIQLQMICIQLQMICIQLQIGTNLSKVIVSMRGKPADLDKYVFVYGSYGFFYQSHRCAPLSIGTGNSTEL